MQLMIAIRHRMAEVAGFRLLWPLATGGVLAVFVLSLLWIAGAPIDSKLIFAVYVGAIAIIAAGEILLRLAGLSIISARLPAAIVLGGTATSLFLLMGVTITGMQASTVFMIWIGIIVATLIAAGPKNLLPPTRDEAIDIFVVACLALLIGYWCRDCAATIPQLKVTGVLPVWTDYYIHGATVAQFGDARAVHRGSILLADQSWVFYHYSSYMLAAALAGVVDFSGLGLSTAVQLPVGLLLAAMGSYALATTLADRRAGAIVIAFLMLLPDASTYGFANGYFGFFWMLFTGPGAGYALGSATVSLISLIEWFRTSNRRALALALAVAGAMFQERVQIFIWFVPAVAMMLALHTDFARRHARKMAWSTTGIGLLTITLLLSIPPLRRVWLEFSVAQSFIAYVHVSITPTAYSGVYEQLVASFGDTAGIILGTGMLVPITLGLFVILYPALFIAKARRQGWQIIDLFPLFVLLAFLFCVWFAPSAPGGDYGEFKQRGFVLLYQVTLIWTAAFLCRLVPVKLNAPISTQVAVALIFITTASMATGWITGFDPARPRLAIGRDYFRVPVYPGLVEAAEYVRTLARPNDTVAVAPIEPAAVLTDHATELASLTNIPSYVARASMVVNKVGHRREVTAERIFSLSKLEDTADFPSAVALLRLIGVNWYIRIGTMGPPFDKTRNHASFVSNNVTVYHLTQESVSTKIFP